MTTPWSIKNKNSIDAKHRDLVEKDKTHGLTDHEESSLKAINRLKEHEQPHWGKGK